MQRTRYSPEFSEELDDKLESLKKDLDFVLESAQMGTWDINLSSGKILCSLRMLNIWEVSPSEIKGDRHILQDKVHPDDLEKMRRELDEAIKLGSTYETTFKIVLKDGREKTVYSRGRCRYDPHTKEPLTFFGIVKEMTK